MKEFLERILSNKIIQAVLFVLFIWLMYEIRIILVILLFAFIVMSGMKPLITKLVQYGWPRPLAIFAPYLALFGFLSMISYGVLPVILSQMQKLITNLPDYIERVAQFLTSANVPVGDLVSTASSFVQPTLDSLLFLPGAVAVFLVGVATILFISIYLLWDPNYLYKKISWSNHHGQTDILAKTEKAMGMWLRGQLIIALIVGLMTGIGLALLGVEFALTLAIISALFEFIPYVGPVLAAIIAMTVALGDSWLLVGLVGLLYLFVQQVESNILVPQVMKRSVNLHPITIIVSILIGSHFMGIVGALVAVPIVTIGTIVFEEARGSYRL